MRPKALLYRLGEDTETGRALRAGLRAQQILTLTVEANQLGETAGRLAAANAAGVDAPTPPDAPETAFLLLCALGDRQLDRLLAAMRRAGVSVPYKAVLTEHNREWRFRDLIAEVAREHEFLKNSQ
ncbi:MAG: DUF3783 domain-containing protein [Oscillospiraceae bacterium]|nr:DUF3783 domain-containing protein [Oscillospiraceae bacterium]